jgi:nucleoid-associated protein YgaU
MSCQIGSSYKIQSGDTLFDIAEQQLGSGERWKEIMKPNGTPFSEEEANNLQVDQEICLPNG